MPRQTDTKVASARVSDAEMRDIDEAAAAMKLSRNAFLRKVILAAVRKVKG